MKVKKKKRPNHYEEKLHVDSSFADLIKVVVSEKEIERNLSKKAKGAKKKN